jgi:predicted dehydrogenase
MSAPNLITVRPAGPPIAAPSPPILPGKVLVWRVHSQPQAGRRDPARRLAGLDWVAGLLARYPRAWRKGMWHLRIEGLRGTWVKVRTRSTLARWDTRSGVFAAVGLVVAGPPEGPAAGAPVLCWSWQGPVDADVHLVAREQCLPVPHPAPEYTLAPLLGWILSVLRQVKPGVAACRLVGMDARLRAPIETMLGPPVAGGRRVVVGCGAAIEAAPDEVVVRLSGERAITSLVAPSERSWVCRLPDPAHFFLDPYYPGPPELPEPFGPAAVAEALDVLVRLASAGAPPEVRSPPSWLRTLPLAPARPPGRRPLRVSCLGAGNYVRAVLLHHLRRSADVLVRGVMDIRPEVAAVQGRALGAAFCTTDPVAVLEDAETDLVLVASDHASHADYAVAALRAGKTVHLEKPPVVTREQLDRLLACLREASRPRLHLGYNRRFAPAVAALQRRLDPLDGPTFVTCVVSGYRLSRAHWYNWPNQGTRVAGNLVHWIDLGYRLSGRRRPVWVEVTVPATPAALAWDPIVLSTEFDDGSLATISFSSAGDETFGVRERLDVKRQDLAAEIDDFRTLRVARRGRRERHRYRADKGHAAEMAALARLALADQWDDGTPADLARTSVIQLAAQAALAEGGGRTRVDGLLPPEGR